MGAVHSLLARLRQHARGGAVALGLDLPIGIPRAYAMRCAEQDFLSFLREPRNWRLFFDVCATVDEISRDRPFYPRRGVKGMTRASHAAALGFAGASDLSRHCDMATMERPAGAPVFWTLGANQSGKAAIAAWTDLMIPALLTDPMVLVWPYAGPFRTLLTPGTVALAETYPAEALRHLGIKLTGSKRRHSDRKLAAASIFAVLDLLGISATDAAATAITDGFGPDAAGEDRLDCVLGALCVANVLAGNRPDTAPDDGWIRHWEGWVLGQTALPRHIRPEGLLLPGSQPRLRKR